MTETERAGGGAPSKRKRGRRRGNRQFALTRQGKGYVAVTLGVGVAAVNTGNNLLYLILGLLLSLLLVSGTLSDLALYRLRAHRRLPPRLYAGRAVDVEVLVENRKPTLPSYSLELREEGTHALVEADSAGRSGGGGRRAAKDVPTRPFRCGGDYVVHISASSTHRASYRLLPERRGRHELGRILITTRYPFGLIEKVTRRGEADEVLVYPEVRDVAPPTLQRDPRGEDEDTTRRGIGSEILGLRELRDGDGARDIHWRRSASLGRLVVRERARGSDRALTLVLDERRPGVHAADEEAMRAWEEDLEAAIVECASLAVASLGAGASVAVETVGGTSPRVEPGGDADPILRYLALLEPLDADATPGEVPAESAQPRVDAARATRRVIPVAGAARGGGSAA